MRTASSSARRLAAAFAIAASAAAAGVASARTPGPAGEDRPAPTSATCRICHTDPKFGAAFSHRGLEETADGCMTCHADPAAHVKARGGKGNVPVATRMGAAAERALCLGCHEEEAYAAPKHLEPKGKDARCTACHALHGAPAPSRAKPAAPPGAKAPGPDAAAGKPAPGTAPAKGGKWLSGRAEAGWRFAGGESGRYAEDVNLDDGARLFALGLEGGLDGADPRAARAEVRLDGLGDPHASLRVRARKGDSWKASADARRDELPFLGQGGLHGGESLRESLGASVDLRLSSVARLGLGYDRTDHEGELRGTALEGGIVLPVASEQDRVSQEGWAALDLGGQAWHAKVRQGWLEEDGEDGKRRDESAPGVPDYLTFDDDSSMDGPVTSVVAGGETMDGLLSVEARASRADLDRSVDTQEVRRGVLGSPYSRTVRTIGDRGRIVETQALDAALAFGDRWALEASAERRTLREDGEVRSDSTTVTTAGTTTASASAADRVSQRVLEERLGARHTTAGGFTLRGGAEWIRDRLDRFDASDSGSVRTRGLFASAEGPLCEEVRVRADLRTARSGDAFTPLTPRDRDAARLSVAYRDADAWRAGVDAGVSRLESDRSDLASRGNDLRVWGGFGGEGETTADLGFTVRQLTLETDTLSRIGPALAAGRTESKIRSHVLDLGLGVPLSPAVRLEGGGGWAMDEGTLPVRAFDATLALRWQASRVLAARVEVRRREYDEMGADALDYEATILEVSVEVAF